MYFLYMYIYDFAGVALLKYVRIGKVEKERQVTDDPIGQNDVPRLAKS